VSAKTRHTSIFTARGNDAHVSEARDISSGAFQSDSVLAETVFYTGSNHLAVSHKKISPSLSSINLDKKPGGEQLYPSFTHLVVDLLVRT